MLNRLDQFFFGIEWPFPLLFILFAMGLCAFFAIRKNHLTGAGALAAVVEGTVITWCMGFEGIFLFAVFYVLGNIASKFSERKLGNNTIEEKGSCRDWMQVAANGGVATLAALYYYNTGNNEAVVMFGAAVAEALSDTCAGEIGKLSKANPVSIRTFKEVKKGTSGGVSPLGFLAGFCGSLIIGILWLLVFPIKNRGIAFTVLVFSSYAGCILDSVLGATCQALYEDSETAELTENEFDKEGKPNKLVRGIKWLDNDAVNALCNITCSVFALGMSAIIF